MYNTTDYKVEKTLGRERRGEKACDETLTRDPHFPGDGSPGCVGANQREERARDKVSLLDDKLESERRDRLEALAGESSLLDDSGRVGPGLQGFAHIAVATVVASQVHVGVDVLILVVGLGRGDSLEGGAEEPQGGSPQLPCQ